MRKNWFTTAGGIIAGFAGIPLAVGEYAKLSGHAIAMADWFYLFCIACGVMGPVIIGVGAKGQAEHSTEDQVQSATQEKK